MSRHQGIRPCLLALLCAIAGPLAADSSQQDLNIAFPRETDYVDRLHTDSSESAALSLVLYDTLLYKDPASGRMEGLLAQQWTWNAARTVVEFQLRRDVRFHDGEMLDADDVVYTINLALDPRSNFRQQRSSFGFIQRVTKTGPYSVRLELAHPSALAEEVLATRLVIWPEEYTRRLGHTIHRTAPVGTGPYRVEQMMPGGEIHLLANREYFAGPKPRATFNRIRLRVVPDAQTQIAELLGGGLDFTWDLPADQARFLARDRRFDVKYGSGARITFLSLDAAGRSGSSPLQDPRIRLALAQAIDRQAIATHLAGPGSAPIRYQCHPQQQHCPRDEGDRSATSNMSAARRLLARARGSTPMQLELLVGSRRLLPIAEAIQWQLGNVGVDVQVRQLTLPAWRRSFMQGKSRASLVSFGGDLLDTAATLPVFFDGGGADYARDPRLTQLIRSALPESDAQRRSAIFTQALQLADAQAYTVPLHTVAVNFVYRSDLAYDPRGMPFPDLLRIGSRAAQEAQRCTAC